MPLTCILIAAIALMAFPKGLYRPRGVTALGGVVRFIGHAALAGSPAALLAWADPSLPIEALIGLVVAGIALSTLVLAVASMEGRPVAVATAPTVSDAETVPPLDAGPAPPGISPWLLARVK